MKSRAVFDGEWVSSTPLLNTRFGHDAKTIACEVCGRTTLAPAWYSITRKVYRHKKCWTPEMLR